MFKNICNEFFMYSGGERIDHGVSIFNLYTLHVLLASHLNHVHVDILSSKGVLYECVFSAFFSSVFSSFLSNLEVVRMFCECEKKICACESTGCE